MQNEDRWLKCLLKKRQREREVKWKLCVFMKEMAVKRCDVIARCLNNMQDGRRKRLSTQALATEEFLFYLFFLNNADGRRQRRVIVFSSAVSTRLDSN